MKSLGIILLFLTLSAAYADVYWLRDVFKKRPTAQSNYSEDSIRWQISQLLDFKVLYEEDIRINGAGGILEAGLLRYSYFDFLYELGNYNSDNIIMTNSNTIIKFKDVRYLVYNAGDSMPAICFAFRVPATGHVSALPFGIPEPGSGALYENVVEFPERNAAYATFKNISNAEDAFINCAAQLKSEGYNNIGGSSGATSGFFMTADGSKIVMMDFNEEHHNGFIYKRERKK